MTQFLWRRSLFGLSVMLTQHCKGIECGWTVYLQTVKMINIMFSVFYHNAGQVGESCCGPSRRTRALEALIIR